VLKLQKKKINNNTIKQNGQINNTGDDNVVKTTPFGPTNDDVDHNNVEDLKNQLQHFIYEWAIYKEQNESLKRHIQEKRCFAH